MIIRDENKTKLLLYYFLISNISNIVNKYLLVE